MLTDVKFSINGDSSNMSAKKIAKNEIKMNEILKLIIIDTLDKKNARTIISKLLTIFLKIVLSTTQSTNQLLDFFSILNFFESNRIRETVSTDTKRK